MSSVNVYCPKCGRPYRQTALEERFHDYPKMPIIKLTHGRDRNCSGYFEPLVQGNSLPLLSGSETVIEDKECWGFIEVGDTWTTMFELEEFQWELQRFLRIWYLYKNTPPVDYRVVKCTIPEWAINWSGWKVENEVDGPIIKNETFGLVTPVLNNKGVVNLIVALSVVNILEEWPLVIGREVNSAVPPPPNGWAE
jgi:hypothetical protein